MSFHARPIIAFTIALVTGLGLVLSRSGNAAHINPDNWPSQWLEASASAEEAPSLASERAQLSEFSYSISPATHQYVLRDAESRINKELQIPPELRGPVSFWLKIYTEYTTRHVVIFDAKHPSVVYEVLDFREIAEKAPNQLVFEVKRNKLLNETLAAYRSAFKRLSLAKQPKKLTREEKIILAALAPIRSSQHNHKIREFSHNLQTQTGQRDNIMRGLSIADPFIPKMAHVLEKHGLPADLVYLPLVESSFNTHAVSRLGAVGAWQFMDASAREYLLVDDKRQIDERLSPLKASVAASQLLKRNYRIFGNWPLAITAYNHGTRKLPRGLHPTDDLSEIFSALSPCPKKGKALGWASRNYYLEFIALDHAINYRHLYYGVARPPINRAVTFWRLSKPQTGLEAAQSLGVALNDFILFNQDVKNMRAALPPGFWVAVPSIGTPKPGTSAGDNDLAGLMELAKSRGPAKISSKPAVKNAPINSVRARPSKLHQAKNTRALTKRS